MTNYLRNAIVILGIVTLCAAFVLPFIGAGWAFPPIVLIWSRLLLFGVVKTHSSPREKDSLRNGEFPITFASNKSKDAKNPDSREVSTNPIREELIRNAEMPEFRNLPPLARRDAIRKKWEMDHPGEKSPWGSGGMEIFDHYGEERAWSGRSTEIGDHCRGESLETEVFKVLLDDGKRRDIIRQV